MNKLLALLASMTLITLVSAADLAQAPKLKGDCPILRNCSCGCVSGQPCHCQAALKDDDYSSKTKNVPQATRIVVDPIRAPRRPVLSPVYYCPPGQN